MATTFDRGNAPQIPQRIVSARTSLSSPKDRKRRSLPASPHDDARRRSSKHPIVVKSASPEVITSLIETLSAISSPAEQHSDRVPNITESYSTPVSPSAWDSHFPRSGSLARPPRSPLVNRSSIDEGSRTGSISRSQRGYLHPGHAINTPERRSSRRISSDTDKAREAAYETVLDDAYTIGTPSIEPGIAPPPSPKQPNKRKSLRSLRSARSLKSLVMNRSTDSLRNSEVPVYITKKEPEPKIERLFLADSRSSSPVLGDLTIKKRETPVDAFDLLHTNDDIVSPRLSLTSKRLYIDSEDAASSSAGPNQSKRSSYNFPNQESIPTRSSSKRHSSTLTSRTPRSKPPRSEHSATQESEVDVGTEQFHTPPQTPQAAVTGFDEASVNRRIEQLKEQKAKRDRLSVEAMSTTELPLRKSRSPSPSPLSQDQSPDPKPAPVLGIKIPNGHIEGPTQPENNDESAPSPSVRAVPLRTDRNTETKINSLSIKPVIIKHSPRVSQDDSKSMGSPHRTNSRLLKRLSQPGSPVVGDRTRRRFSNPLGNTPPNRNTSYQSDSGDSIDDVLHDYLSSPRLSQKITHPHTGRVISFSEVGDPNGSVVFCCVGMGLTRYITAFYDELATTLKLRLITPDRPGVGGSEPHADGNDTPLGWPDDVRSICEHRGITKFSILAHSAGAIYALATALRMPQHIRCRVHLLAPWIPPSQMSAIGTNKEPLPTNAMPYSQRFLRSLPTAFLRAANSSFLSVTSNSITTSLPRSPRRSKRSMSRSMTPTATDTSDMNSTDSPSSPTARLNPADQTHDKENRPPFTMHGSNSLVNIAKDSQPPSTTSNNNNNKPPEDKAARQSTYESRLASSIWNLAVLNANPSVDLLVCLERRQPIGFRYVDITRAVVIHHGSKDSRVPVENVKWLGKMMRRCEVRVLEGEGHGLMASASVMGAVLMEMAGEWEDWNRVVRGDRKV